MAKLAITAAFLFFFLFTFSYARTPLNLQLSEAALRDVMTISPAEVESETRLIDDEKVKHQPRKTEFQPFKIKGHPIEFAEGLPAHDIITVDSIQRGLPLETITFRPINRHFPPKLSVASFAQSRPACGHRHRSNKPYRLQVSYGNDMILSTDASNLDSMALDHGIRAGQVTHIRFDRHHQHHDKDRMPRFWSKGEEKFKEYKKSHYYHKEELKNEKKKKKDTKREDQIDFLMQIRKFLNF